MKWGDMCHAWLRAWLTGIQERQQQGPDEVSEGVWCGALATITTVALKFLYHSRCPGNCQAPGGMILSLQEQRVREGRDAPTSEPEMS